MKHMAQSLVLGVVATLASMAAWADGAASPAGLDLTPPEPAMFSGDAGTPYRNDPPGTYYGDTTGGLRDEAVSRCPTAADGSQRAITGSATVGMGWSSRGGTSQYRGLDLNYCKDMADGDGDGPLFNASVHVDQVEADGFDGASRRAGSGGYPPMQGPPPMRAPRGGRR